MIAAGFSYVAGYGIRLLPIIQSRSQLRAVYGEHGSDEIVANCGVEIAFTPKELKVANELSERIGFIGQASVSKSFTQDGFFSKRSRSISDQRRALILPQELMKFPECEMLLLRGGMSVVRATKIRFFDERFFKSRLYAAPLIAPIAAHVDQNIALPECVPLSEEQLSGADSSALERGVIRLKDYQFMFQDVATKGDGDKRVGVIAEGRDL